LQTRWFRTIRANSGHRQPLLARIETGAPEAMLFVSGITRGMFYPNHPCDS